MHRKDTVFSLSASVRAASPHLSQYIYTMVFVCVLVLQGNASCDIENHGGVVTLRPLPGCVCRLNDREIAEPCRLAQGQFPSKRSGPVLGVPDLTLTNTQD